MCSLFFSPQVWQWYWRNFPLKAVSLNYIFQLCLNLSAIFPSWKPCQRRDHQSRQALVQVCCANSSAPKWDYQLGRIFSCSLKNSTVPLCQKILNSSSWPIKSQTNYNHLYCFMEVFPAFYPTVSNRGDVIFPTILTLNLNPIKGSLWQKTRLQQFSNKVASRPLWEEYCKKMPVSLFNIAKYLGK